VGACTEIFFRHNRRILRSTDFKRFSHIFFFKSKFKFIRLCYDSHYKYCSGYIKNSHGTFLEFTEPDKCTAEPVVQEPTVDEVEIVVEKL
jgi:hypothetical protein